MLADKVQAIAAELGVPRGLAQLGVCEADIATLARSALADACLATNPRPAAHDDLVALFRAAL
jgi:alcohol dehydrogenase